MKYIIHRDALDYLYKQLDKFAERYNPDKKIVMFGTSKIAGMIITYLQEKGVNIYGIIDNDDKRQGKKYCDIVVGKPEKLIQDTEGNVYVLIASSHQNEMIAQLESMGLVYGENIEKIIDLPQLMNRYNFVERSGYVKLTEDEIKQHQLGILSYLKKVCEENGLRYFLCGGTLLGAARHKGFIPWDDDIDVFVELNDLEKLHEILKNDSRYKLISMFDDSGYFDECSLLVDMNTVCDINRFPMQVTAGVSIDVFFVSGLPDGEEAVKVMDEARRLETICCNTIYSREKNREAINNLIEYLKQYDFDRCPKVAHVLGRFAYKEITSKKYFESAVKLPFEGEMFDCPVGWDEYLTDIYGEYMKLPPESERVKHHYFNSYRRKE